MPEKKTKSSKIDDILVDDPYRKFIEIQSNPKLPFLVQPFDFGIARWRRERTIGGNRRAAWSRYNPGPRRKQRD
jgi:hypothetical protein